MQQLLIHKHYEGAAHSFEIVTPADPVAGDYVRPDVTILKTFFINDSVNKNDWQATWEGLKKDAEELPGVPLVLQEDLEHPKFSVQEMYDRGTIFDYDIDEENHQIIVYVRITDSTIIDRIKSGELEFVSPAVIPRGSETLRKVNGVDVLDRTLPLHLAIVGNPAYGTDKAKMSHLCSGDGQACYHRLKQMTASTSMVKKIIKKEHELLDQGIDEYKVHQMLEKEFGADYRTSMFESDGDGGDGGNSGIKSNLKLKQADQIDSLTQMPLIKKMIAKIARIGSTIEKVKTGSVLYPLENKFGRWINAQGIDVFVAENQSIAEAMTAQCGCTSLGPFEGVVVDGKEGEWITARGHHIFIPDGANPNTWIKNHFDKLEQEDKSKKPETKSKPKEEKPQEKPKQESKEYPMGTTTEDRAARAKHFEKHSDANLEVGELTSNERGAQLDRNIANVLLSRAKRDGGDVAAAEKHLAVKDKELADIKEKLKSTTEALRKDGALEGVLAQNAMLWKKHLQEKLATHREGTKIHEKVKWDVAGVEFRLDLIRRGKMPDLDVDGKNPYQKAPDAPPSKHAKPAAVAKSFEKSTSADLKSLKHNVNSRIVGHVDSGHLKEVTAQLNKLSPEDMAGVKNVVIKGSTARGSFTSGEWIEKTSTMNITTHDSSTPQDYSETIHHEVGHVKYKSYTPEQVEKWTNAVKDGYPPTNYAKQHRDRAIKYTSDWKNSSRYNKATPEEKIIIDNNVKALTAIYHEEIHSEVISHIRSGGLNESKIYLKKGLDDSVKAYKEIFS